MPIAWLDHVNIRTTNLEAMTHFYADVLGLTLGPRPPFSFDGAWLYCGDKAAVHLVSKPDVSTGESSIDHFAFRATGLEQFVHRLKANNVPYRITVVPQLELRQVRISDPDGNRIEVAFPAEKSVDPAELS
jgi:catechol 2,3-dioxygenase-like lactoylglutathione lyase family enzyme